MPRCGVSLSFLDTIDVIFLTPGIPTFVNLSNFMIDLYLRIQVRASDYM